MDCDGKSESSPEREAVDDETKGAEGTDGIKKRKRKPYRPGRVCQLDTYSFFQMCMGVFCKCILCVPGTPRGY